MSTSCRAPPHTIGPALQSEQFERIQDFWSRRQQLTQGELAEFYQRTLAALAPCRPREAASLGDSLADLRHQFFIEKVLGSESASVPLHVGALCPVAGGFYLLPFHGELLRGVERQEGFHALFFLPDGGVELG